MKTRLILLSTIPILGFGSAAADILDSPAVKRAIARNFAPRFDVEPQPQKDLEVTFYSEVSRMIGGEKEAQETARQRLERALEAGGLSESAEALFRFDLGNLYFHQGKIPEAAMLFRRAVELFPDFLRAHKNLGLIFVRADRPKRAVQHLTKVIELGDADATVYGLLGASYVKLERSTEAESAFRQAVMLAPTVSDWKLGLVQALFGEEKFEDAASLLSSLAAAEPEKPLYQTLLASAYLGQKQMLEAAKTYELLDARGEAGAKEMNTLGDIYANEDLLEPAASAYLRAYELAPDDVNNPLRAAEVLAARDGEALASELLQQVRDRAGDGLAKEDRLRMARVQARIAFSRDEGEAAAKMLEDVVREDPLDGASLVRLGDYYGSIGKTALAIRRYESAASIADTSADAQVKHGQLLVSEGQYKEAIVLLRDAQQKSPRESVGKFLEQLEAYVKRRG